MKEAFERGVADLFPGYFALVMATGILSIATYRLDMPLFAWGLLIINVVAYVILWLLTLLRLARYLPRVLADITDHARGPGFFTLVAGTCVLGSQLVIVADESSAATLLWWLGIGLWLLVMYTFFTAVTVREAKPSLETGINGAWLIGAVATQSISVLGTLLALRHTGGRDVLLFFTLCMYLLGCMLYVSIIALIFYRLTFVKLTIDTLTPPYWINMGAAAISTLAGATLIAAAPQWPFLGDVLPFLKGFTLFFWAAGTWWMPLLLILGVWRHLYMRRPLTYDPQHWGIIFPLGMYTACTVQLAASTGLDFLLIIPRAVVYIALLAWLATFAGLVHSLGRSSVAATHMAGRRP